MPVCPSVVQGNARREWTRIVQELEKRGILDRVDSAALAAYCVSFARWQDAEAMVKKQGLVVTTIKGNQIQNPALGVANKAMQMCVKYAEKFGLTPASRATVGHSAAEDVSMEPPV